jgi:hypothetical protein
MKTTSQRIAYFVTKVTQRSAIHPAKAKPNWFDGRHERLMKYKRELHKRIAADKMNM